MVVTFIVDDKRTLFPPNVVGNKINVFSAMFFNN